MIAFDPVPNGYGSAIFNKQQISAKFVEKQELFWRICELNRTILVALKRFELCAKRVKARARCKNMIVVSGVGGFQIRVQFFKKCC